MSALPGSARDITDAEDLHFAELVSANAGWRVVKPLLATETIGTSPYGEYFFGNVDGERVLFFQGGWGKEAAAGSTQYAIGSWDCDRPSLPGPSKCITISRLPADGRPMFEIRQPPGQVHLRSFFSLTYLRVVDARIFANENAL